MTYCETDVAALLHCASRGDDRYLAQSLIACRNLTEYLRVLQVGSSGSTADYSRFDEHKAILDRYSSGSSTPSELAQLETIRRLGISVIPYGDKRYPALLTEIPDPPPVLYHRGVWSDLNTPQIAMVGARQASGQARKIAHELSSRLAAMGLVITSGLALGVDSRAHEGALTQGHTISVLAHGIDQIYPRRHQALAQKILERGCLISEQPLFTHPNKATFPKRNRLISGLSLGVIIVEAAPLSGTLVTARHALEQNRELWVLPWSIFHHQGRGGLELLSQGAQICLGPEDVVRQLASNPLLENAMKLAKGVFSKRRSSEDTSSLLSRFNDGVTTFEALMQSGCLSRESLQAELVELELSGSIRKTPQGYIRV